MRFFSFAFLVLLPCVVLGQLKSSFLKQNVLINTNDPLLGVDYRSGFIPIGPNGSRMFYWYFPSETKQQTQDTPFLLWLTGGPGCSSMTAELLENGPILVKEDGRVVLNEFSWNKLGDLVYVDQPLGVGFSELVGTEKTMGTEFGIAFDLREFLMKFIEEYPSLKNRPFYITGESYAGHYIPALGAYLLENPVPGLNLKGVAIGNGWVDGETQYPAYADFALQNHMISRERYFQAKDDLALCMKHVEEGSSKANDYCDRIYFGPLLGKRNVYDIGKVCKAPPLCYDMSAMQAFINDKTVQKALGVNKKWETCNFPLHDLFDGDWIISVKDKVAEMLEGKLDVLIYSGDKDYVCNWVGGERWTRAVEWEKQQEFNDKAFINWLVNGIPAGEVRRVDNFSFLRIYNAGHMTPMDQPEVSFEMLRQFFKAGSLEV